LFIGANNN